MACRMAATEVHAELEWQPLGWRSKEKSWQQYDPAYTNEAGGMCGLVTQERL